VNSRIVSQLGNLGQNNAIYTVLRELLYLYRFRFHVSNVNLFG